MMDAASVMLAVKLLNIVQAGFSWLTNRGITRDQALALLQTAEDENRDVTTQEVADMLDLTDDELAETQAMIDAMG